MNTDFNSNYTPKSVADAVQKYTGVQRKGAIGKLVSALKMDSSYVIASYGEDAAVIQNGDNALLLAADGIWSQLMDVDPYWAGYCAILVNIHDIAAMGGTPLAIVDVLSSTGDEKMSGVARGMHDAAYAFNVPIVGGHFHPDASYNVVDAAIMGITKLDDVIYSNKAQNGDAIIVAIDLDGRIHPSCQMNWDTVTMKPKDILRSQIAILHDLGRSHLLTAAKDISNPGIIGTLGMLLEASGVGGVIDLTTIPHPDLATLGINYEHWLMMYPGMGFVMTAKQNDAETVCRRFKEVGLIARIIGTVNTTNKLIVTKGNSINQQEEIVFNFTKNGVTNIS